MSSTRDFPDFPTWLAQLDDAALEKILLARPDVLHPMPPSITPLAGRLQLAPSINRALRKLNAADLTALKAAAELGAEFEPVARQEIEERSGGVSVDKLLAHALLYGDEYLRMVPTPIPAFAAADPPPPAPERDQAAIDASATAQGLDATSQVARTIEYIAAHPVALNRDNTLGVRAGSALTAALGEHALRAVALASAAGLIGRGDVEEAPHLAPTPHASDWLDAPLAEQWHHLLTSWRTNPWRYWTEDRLFTERDDSLHALRGRVIQQFERTDDPAAGLRFYAPLLKIVPEDLTALISEAEWIGAIAAHAPTSWLHAVLRGADFEVEVPPEATYVIVQTDLTLLAPGPLPAPMQREVDAFADLESPGLASVYRITEASLRRALDTGRSADDILGWLREHAVGDIPQTLDYLLRDLSSRHGQLRGGVALSYLRSEDPTLLDVLPDIGLRRLAPTVVVSSRRLADVIRDLADHGIHASAEDDAGAIIDIRPDPPIVPPEDIFVPTPPAPGRAQAALATLRSATDTATYSGSDSISILRAATRSGRQVRIATVDRNGRELALVVTPLTVSAGNVDARGSDGQVLRLPLHRIARVAVL